MHHTAGCCQVTIGRFDVEEHNGLNQWPRFWRAKTYTSMFVNGLCLRLLVLIVINDELYLCVGTCYVSFGMTRQHFPGSNLGVSFTDVCEVHQVLHPNCTAFSAFTFTHCTQIHFFITHTRTMLSKPVACMSTHRRAASSGWFGQQLGGHF